MEELANLEWVPVVVSFVLAFGLGWLWYSPMMFLKPWASALGLDTEGPNDGMMKAMIPQAIATFLLAVVTNMDFGHTDPMFVLPYGIEAKIDADAGTFSIVENAVTD